MDCFVLAAEAKQACEADQSEPAHIEAIILRLNRGSGQWLHCRGRAVRVDSGLRERCACAQADGNSGYGCYVSDLHIRPFQGVRTCAALLQAVATLSVPNVEQATQYEWEP